MVIGETQQCPECHESYESCMIGGICPKCEFNGIEVTDPWEFSDKLKKDIVILKPSAWVGEKYCDHRMKEDECFQCKINKLEQELKEEKDRSLNLALLRDDLAQHILDYTRENVGCSIEAIIKHFKDRIKL